MKYSFAFLLLVFISACKKDDDPQPSFSIYTKWTIQQEDIISLNYKGGALVKRDSSRFIPKNEKWELTKEGVLNVYQNSTIPLSTTFTEKGDSIFIKKGGAFTFDKAMKRELSYGNGTYTWYEKSKFMDIGGYDSTISDIKYTFILNNQ